MDQTLDWLVGKQRAPAAENKALPESSQTAVAIAERMDELEFVVKDRAGDEGVLTRCRCPAWCKLRSTDSMASRIGSSATTSRQPRQARKGATVAVMSGAGVQLVRAASQY